MNRGRVVNCEGRGEWISPRVAYFLGTDIARRKSLSSNASRLTCRLIVQYRALPWYRTAFPLACALLGKRACFRLFLLYLYNTKLKPYALNEPPCGFEKRNLCGVCIYCPALRLDCTFTANHVKKKTLFGKGGMSWVFRFSFFWKIIPL